MRNHLYLIFCFFLTSCISVKVPLGPAEKAKDLKFQAPAAPFFDLDSETADFSWISEKTGNTLSILSECKESKLTAKEVALDTARGIDDHKILKSESKAFQNFDGHKVMTTGLLDNSEVQMVIHTFKASNCFVTLTYGGLRKNFLAEEKVFDQFQSSLVVP